MDTITPENQVVNLNRVSTILGVFGHGSLGDNGCSKTTGVSAENI